MLRLPWLAALAIAGCGEPETASVYIVQEDGEYLLVVDAPDAFVNHGCTADPINVERKVDGEWVAAEDARDSGQGTSRHHFEGDEYRGGSPYGCDFSACQAAFYVRRLNLHEYVVVGERDAPEESGLADGTVLPVVERREIVGEVRVCIPLHDSSRCYPDPPFQIPCATAVVE